MAAAMLDAKRAALGDISNQGASGLLAAAGDKVPHARGPPRSGLRVPLAPPPERAL